MPAESVRLQWKSTVSAIPYRLYLKDNMDGGVNLAVLH